MDQDELRKMDQAELHKTLTVPRGTAVAVSMIVGSGLLVLPGLAYAQAGSSAVYAWLLGAGAVVPLLLVFARLGSRHPNAGGVMGFAQVAFGRAGAAGTAYLLLGACAFGGASMAITGGNYLGALFGDPRAAVPAAFCYLIVVSVLNALGSRLAGGVQTVATTTLVLLIATVAVAPFATPGFTAAGTVAPVGSWTAALPVVGLIFFAYTGWELVASTTEEYRNPRRDLPLVLGLSFAVIVTLYVGVALAVQVTLAPDDPLLRTAPLVAVLNRVVGEASARATAALGCAIIFTTLMGGTWATSRIAFATARERLLPLRLSRVHSGSGAPRPAIVVSALLFGGVMLAYASGALTLDVIIKLSAVNFIIGYAISIAAYARFCIRWRERLIAVLAAGPIIGLLVGFGWWLLLPFALFAMGVAAHRLSRDGVLVEVRAAALTRAGDDDPIRS